MRDINIILKATIHIIYIIGLLGFLNLFVEKKYCLRQKLFKNNPILKKILLIIIFILFEGICFAIFYEKANNTYFRYSRLAIFIYLLNDGPTKK